MTWKESIISIGAQIQAATGRKLGTARLMQLVHKSSDGTRWEAEYRGVIYTRPADTERRQQPRRGKNKQNDKQ